MKKIAQNDEFYGIIDLGKITFFYTYDYEIEKKERGHIMKSKIVLSVLLVVNVAIFGYIAYDRTYQIEATESNSINKELTQIKEINLISTSEHKNVEEASLILEDLDVIEEYEEGLEFEPVILETAINITSSLKTSMLMHGNTWIDKYYTEVSAKTIEHTEHIIQDTYEETKESQESDAYEKIDTSMFHTIESERIEQEDIKKIVDKLNQFVNKRDLGEANAILETFQTITFDIAYPIFENAILNEKIELFVQGRKESFIESCGASDLLEELSGQMLEEVNQNANRFYITYNLENMGKNQIKLDFYEVGYVPVDYVSFDGNDLEKKRELTEKTHTFYYNTKTAEELNLDTVLLQNLADSVEEISKIKMQLGDYVIQYMKTDAILKNQILWNFDTYFNESEAWLETWIEIEGGLRFYIDTEEIWIENDKILELDILFTDFFAYLESLERNIDVMKPMVALTYDDGPHPVHTTRILDVLAEYEVPATFFDLGQQIERYPEILLREVEEGHEIGNHSYKHDNFRYLTEAQILEDLRVTNEIFRQVIGYEPVIFRPPYGSMSDLSNAVMPLATIYWSVDTRDWESRNTQAIINQVLSYSDLDGQVILMHGIYETSAEATEYIVPYLLQQGYQLVTISELLEYRYGKPPTEGDLYGYGAFHSSNQVQLAQMEQQMEELEQMMQEEPISATPLPAEPPNLLIETIKEVKQEESVMEEIEPSMEPIPMAPPPAELMEESVMEEIEPSMEPIPMAPPPVELMEGNMVEEAS